MRLRRSSAYSIWRICPIYNVRGAVPHIGKSDRANAPRRLAEFRYPPPLWSVNLSLLIGIAMLILGDFLVLFGSMRKPALPISAFTGPPSGRRRARPSALKGAATEPPHRRMGARSVGGRVISLVDRASSVGPDRTSNGVV